MSFVSPVSTVPVVKAALVAALLARTEMAAPTLVSYGEPGPYLPDDIVAVMDTAQTFDVMAMVGSGAGKWLSETFVIEVQVDCFLGGDAAQAVEERALFLASVVVDVVRVDPSIGALVIEARPASMRTTGSWEDDRKGRRAQVVLTFTVTTQL